MPQGWSYHVEKIFQETLHGFDQAVLSGLVQPRCQRWLAALMANQAVCDTPASQSLHISQQGQHQVRTMTQNDSSLSTATCTRVTRRRSLSVGSNLHLLAAIMEEEPVYTQSEDDMDEKHTRSQSESVICTAQGVKFEVKYQKYQTRLDNLMALAANPTSSNSNALLAKKALQYRNKTTECRRAYSFINSTPLSH